MTINSTPSCILTDLYFYAPKTFVRLFEYPYLVVLYCADLITNRLVKKANFKRT